MVVAIVVVLGLDSSCTHARARPLPMRRPRSSRITGTTRTGFEMCDILGFKLEWRRRGPGTNGFANIEFARRESTATKTASCTGSRSTSASVGANANSGVFPRRDGVELTNNKLTFPESQRAGLPYAAGDGRVRERRDDLHHRRQAEEERNSRSWCGTTSPTDNGTTYIADFDNIRLDQDQVVVAIAFVPNNTDVSMPPVGAGPPVARRGRHRPAHPGRTRHRPRRSRATRSLRTPSPTRHHSGHTTTGS